MTKEEQRLKKIKYLIYLKSELIKQARKEIKELHQEAQMIEGYKVLERRRKK